MINLIVILGITVFTVGAIAMPALSILGYLWLIGVLN